MFRLIIACLAFFCAQPLFAGGGGGGVVLDGSFGVHGALPGPNFIIPANVGKQIGGNLFQSFTQFNLNNTQSATFTGPSNVQNILSRVTGGSPSSIDGAVNSEIQGANLFFLNPAGVMFGPDAQLNVSGSVAISTANYLKMADGGRFNANLGGGDVLTSAPVSSFGFLNSTPGRVSIASGNTVDADGTLFLGSNLTAGLTGSSFSVVAGEIALNGAYIGAFSGSRVNLVSVGSGGEVQLDATDINSAVDVTQFAKLGEIDLNAAYLNTSQLAGGPGGPVVIRGESFFMDHSSQIFSDTRGGSVQGGAIDIALSQTVKISNLSNIATEPVFSGHSGNIFIKAQSILLDNECTVSTAGSEGGDPGNVTVQANDLTLQNSFLRTDAFDANGGNLTINASQSLLLRGSGIDTDTNGIGRGGNVIVNAGSVILNDFSSISAVTRGQGNAGDVTIHAINLQIESGGISTSTFDRGDAGNISITGTSLAFEGVEANPFFAGSIESKTTAQGDAGNIIIRATDLQLANGALIDTSTSGDGNGGNISVTANSLSIAGANSFRPSEISAVTSGRGNAGTIVVQAPDVAITASGEISSSTSGSGNGGNVIIDAAHLMITSGAQISASTMAQGRGGNVTTTSDALLIDGSNAGIFAVAGHAGLGSSGIGGDVVVSADDLSLQNGGTISAASFTSAAAGSINLSLGTLSMNSGSSISSANAGNGVAGSVSIDTTGSVKLRHGSSISVSSELSDAGDIDLFADGPIKLSSGSSITASAGTDGGNIHLRAPELVYLKDSSITAEAGPEKNGSGFGGTGGNITIEHPRFIILKKSTISANAAAGQGGNINLISDFFFNSKSLITATGTTNNGTINITAPNLDLGAELITLPSSLIGAETQLQERCAALLHGDFSSFIVVGKGGTEPPPDELQPAF